MFAALVALVCNVPLKCKIFFHIVFLTLESLKYLYRPVNPDHFEMVPGKQICLPGTVDICCLFVASTAGRAASGRLFFRLVASTAGRTTSRGHDLLIFLCPTKQIRKCHNDYLHFYFGNIFCSLTVLYRRAIGEKSTHLFIT